MVKILELNFEEPEEFTLPDGTVCQIVGIRLRDIKKGLDINKLQKSLPKINKYADKAKGKSEDVSELKISDMPEELLTLMDEVIEFGIIDKKTEKLVKIPRKYRNMGIDITLSTKIMNATLRGAPEPDPLPQKKQ